MPISMITVSGSFILPGTYSELVSGTSTVLPMRVHLSYSTRSVEALGHTGILRFKLLAAIDTRPELRLDLLQLGERAGKVLKFLELEINAG